VLISPGPSCRAGNAWHRQPALSRPQGTVWWAVTGCGTIPAKPLRSSHPQMRTDPFHHHLPARREARDPTPTYHAKNRLSQHPEGQDPPCAAIPGVSDKDQVAYGAVHRLLCIASRSDRPYDGGNRHGGYRMAELPAITAAAADVFATHPANWRQLIGGAVALDRADLPISAIHMATGYKAERFLLKPATCAMASTSNRCSTLWMRASRSSRLSAG